MDQQHSRFVHPDEYFHLEVMRRFNQQVHQTIMLVTMMAGPVMPLLGTGAVAIEGAAAAAAVEDATAVAVEEVAVAETAAADTAETVAADATAAGGEGPSFISAADGSVFPVPKGATGPVPTRVPGMQFTGGSGGHGLDPRVTGVRFMDSNANQGARAVYMNRAGQTVNPLTGRTVPHNDPNAHFYFNAKP